MTTTTRRAAQVIATIAATCALTLTSQATASAETPQQCTQRVTSQMTSQYTRTHLRADRPTRAKVRAACRPTSASYTVSASRQVAVDFAHETKLDVSCREGDVVTAAQLHNPNPALLSSNDGGTGGRTLYSVWQYAGTPWEGTYYAGPPLTATVTITCGPAATA
jgi:hypothetical protein